MARLVCGLWLLLTTLTGWANEVYAPSDIPLLNNRFRIDPKVEEITFFIYREAGTAPAILVQPDGSKLYHFRAPESVRWLSLPDKDLITIEHPMPGPWQTIAQVDPRNRIRLVTDLAMALDKLPLRVYSGEQLKVTGRLLEHGKIPTDPFYLSDVGMTMKLLAFAGNDVDPSGEPRLIGRFKDNGQDLDEKPEDGVVTARMDMTGVDGGKYRVVISTGNEIFVRSQFQTLLVYPLPVRIEQSPASNEYGPRLNFYLDEDELLPGSVAIRGSVQGEFDEGEQFAVQGDGDPHLAVQLKRPELEGRYTINMTLFGTTKNGQRQVMIKLPSEEFNIYPLVEAVEVSAASMALAPEPVPEPEGSLWWLWLSLGGVVLLGSAAGLLFWLKQRAFRRALLQPEPDLFAPAPDKPKSTDDDELDLNRLD
ncbi:TIGR03503 family protein [Pseudaeromonas paramecii]|uniref:TIGR03503 family protein n=1 Tax=Pseudaeromonas paramecii TaxID=2138166 RepID=A0ABP8Q3S9_9GAMM